MDWATAAAEIVAFLIVVWFVVRYLVPFFRNATAQRQKAISEQLENTRKEQAEAEQAEAEFNRAHDSLEEETARLRDDARKQSEQIIEELRERAQTESARILHRGQEHLAAERDTAVRTMRGDAGRLAVDLAEQVVTQFLQDAGRRRASVGRALEAITADGGGSPQSREAALAPVSTGEGRI